MPKTIAVLLSLCILFGCSKPAPKSPVVNRSEEPYGYTDTKVISSEGNREPPLNGRTGGSSHGGGDGKKDRNTSSGNKGLVKWVIGKWQSAWKRPYWSNMWHTSQWDWRHGTTALFGATVLSYCGYRGVKYATPKIKDLYLNSNYVQTKRAKAQAREQEIKECFRTMDEQIQAKAQAREEVQQQIDNVFEEIVEAINKHPINIKEIEALREKQKALYEKRRNLP